MIHPLWIQKARHNQTTLKLVKTSSHIEGSWLIEGGPWGSSTLKFEFKVTSTTTFKNPEDSLLVIIARRNQRSSNGRQTAASQQSNPHGFWIYTARHLT
jgi:hypothetical protein